ncbi:MAG: 2OG-Fe(II) oxygenase, partial [Alphaproteobacteria bacterium]
IQGLLKRRLIPEINKAFRFDVIRAEVYRIGCYDAESSGYFRRHRDLGAPHLAYRSFALSLNLNTGDYEGGHIRFPEFGPGLYQPPLGGGVVFSCSLLHEALPVTKGRRFALFTFFSGKTLE